MAKANIPTEDLVAMINDPNWRPKPGQDVPRFVLDVKVAETNRVAIADAVRRGMAAPAAADFVASQTETTRAAIEAGDDPVAYRNALINDALTSAGLHEREAKDPRPTPRLRPPLVVAADNAARAAASARAEAANAVFDPAPKTLRQRVRARLRWKRVQPQRFHVPPKTVSEIFAQPRCGKWMPIAKANCMRVKRHEGRCSRTP